MIHCLIGYHLFELTVISFYGSLTTVMKGLAVALSLLSLAVSEGKMQEDMRNFTRKIHVVFALCHCNSFCIVLLQQGWKMHLLLDSQAEKNTGRPRRVSSNRPQKGNLLAGKRCSVFIGSKRSSLL